MEVVNLSSIAENLQEVRNRIAEAADKAGRDPSDVTLVGVTKTVDTARIRELLDLGVTELGENRPQELNEKYEILGNVPHWHLIGHLQTNKVKTIIDKVCMIHSIDSLHLAQEVNKRAAETNRVMDILVELNIASEPSKYGIEPQDTLEFIKQLSELTHIRPVGLMCVAPNVDESEKNRYFFAKMREILFDIKQRIVHNIDLIHLSMGMTKDYEVAVEEGATMVRIGTGIFGSRV
jgi:pyridoxal phosphate enzyme (YggS family)